VRDGHGENGRHVQPASEGARSRMARAFRESNDLLRCVLATGHGNRREMGGIWRWLPVARGVVTIRRAERNRFSGEAGVTERFWNACGVTLLGPVCGPWGLWRRILRRPRRGN
jgi:hypothetical protein